MYKLVYNYRETKGNEVVEREYDCSEEFRLKKDARHSLHNLQEDFEEIKYNAILRHSDKLYCIKTEITTDDRLKTMEWEISIKKV